MISKILYKTLSSLYGKESAMRISIALVSLICVAAFLICFPSLKQFMNGKEIEVLHIVFFIIFTYGLYELYACIQLDDGENKELAKKKADLLVKEKIVKESGNNSYLNLKDTFIFHQKKDYKITERLKRYEAHLIQPTQEIEKPKAEVKGIIADEAEYDILDNLSEKDMAELEKEKERAIEFAAKLEKENVVNNSEDNRGEGINLNSNFLSEAKQTEVGLEPNMDFLEQTDEYEIDLEELEKSQQQLENEDFIEQNPNNIDLTIDEDPLIIDIAKEIENQEKEEKNRFEAKFDIMGEMANLMNEENKNNS